MQPSTPGAALEPGADPASPPPAIRGAYFALTVLFSMNLLNYIDRYVFNAVGPEVTRALGLSDFQFGILGAAFMIVYTVVSPVAGWMGDRYDRKRLLAFGVALWSVATVATSFARDFGQMFLARALLGVGEASYGVVAPTLLADLFPVRARGRVMGVYFLALPLGGALGYTVGGSVNAHWGWRVAFWVVGVPGLIAAVAGLMIRDPGRGASEGHGHAPSRPDADDYRALMRTPALLYNIAGMAAVTFATGAYAVWAPTFYHRVRGMDLARANHSIGAMTATAGLIGIGLGAWLPDRLYRLTRRAYLLWAGLAVGLAVPFALIGILDPEQRSSFSFLFVAMVLMASVLGPSNATTANVVPPNRRAAAYAVSIFLLHLFGDISSPVLIGKLSDILGGPVAAASPVGRFFARIGAGPVDAPTGPTNLTAGMLLVIPMLALGAVFFLLGSRHLPRDQQRARELGGPSADGMPLH